MTTSDESDQEEVMEQDSGSGSGDESPQQQQRPSQKRSQILKTEMPLPEFRQKYDDLVKQIKDLVMQDDGDDNITEQIDTLKQNLEYGTELMRHVGTDNAKLNCTLRHLKACLELADKKCRSMGTIKPFNILKYLDILYNKNLNIAEEYSERKFIRSLTSEMNQYSNSIFSIVSLLGVIDLHAAAPETPAAKTRSVNRSKFTLDGTPATQHQVINSNMKDTVEKEDTLSTSQKMATKLRKMCTGKNLSGLSLYDFGLQDGTTNTHKFIFNIFNAACLGRDGFARIFIDENEPLPKGILCHSNWKIKDAKPPNQEKTGSKNPKNSRRNQHIMSFNARTITALLQSNEGESSTESKSKRKAENDLPQANKKTAKIS